MLSGKNCPKVGNPTHNGQQYFILIFHKFSIYPFLVINYDTSSG